MKKAIILMILCITGTVNTSTQQSIGTPGLIHVPSAEMDTVGVARIGAHYVDQHMIPDYMTCDGEKFNSMTNYLSITPFSWIEIGYGYTLWKLHHNLDNTQRTGFFSKDRYFTLRLQPLKEGRYWPSIVVGGNDVWGSSDDGESGSNYYKNNFIAASKHFDVCGYLIGTHLGYRKWKRERNDRWNGMVGGITLCPAFYQPLRFIGEYDGDGVNVGADCELFHFLLLQASLQKGKYPSAGLCLRISLL